MCVVSRSAAGSDMSSVLLPGFVWCVFLSEAVALMCTLGTRVCWVQIQRLFSAGAAEPWALLSEYLRWQKVLLELELIRRGTKGYIQLIYTVLTIHCALLVMKRILCWKRMRREMLECCILTNWSISYQKLLKFVKYILIRKYNLALKKAVKIY